jgi:hypothetical protein
MEDFARLFGGLLFILKSMELGTSFRSTMPKYPTADPDYRILSRQRARHAYHYFYIRDSGALVRLVGPPCPSRPTFVAHKVLYARLSPPSDEESGVGRSRLRRPLVSACGKLDFSTLPLSGVATRVEHGNDDDDVRFDSEVDGVRKAP